MTSVKLSANLKTIGWYAFQNCTTLTTLELPEGLTQAGHACFNNCTSLASVKIPGSLKDLPSSMFKNADALTAVEIPYGVTDIGNSVFADSAALHTVIMADSVKTMSTEVFRNCSALKNVTLSNSLTTIPSGTFQSCGALESIVIPYKVTKIDSNAFNASPKLAKVLTGSKLTSINTTAFSYKNVTVFYGIPGSYTETWCSNNGYRFNANTVEPIEVTLPEKAISIPKNSTYTITARVAPLDASCELQYKSKNASVATVDENGVIKAVGVGSTTITVVASEDAYTTLKVTVTQAITRLSLNKSKLNLEVPNSQTLKATIAPSDASNQALSWISSDEKVATVDENGTVTAVGNGTVTITVTTTDGTNLSARCTVTVIDPNNIPVSSLKLNTDNLSLEALEEYQLTAAASPANAVNQNILWTSSDETVAIVDETGMVRTLAKGETTITATAADGCGATATCTVRVINSGVIVTELDQFQSSHKYTSNCSDFWIYTDNTASSLILTFAEKTAFEYEGDYLHIYDGNGQLVGSYTGSELAGQTVTVNGSTVKVQIESDSMVNDWGFQVTHVEVITCQHQYTPEITPPGCETPGYTTYTCDSCGHSYEDDYTAAAHTPVNDPAVPGTCNSQGMSAGSHCGVCGETLVAQTPTGYGTHKHQVDHQQTPSCEDSGYTVYKCIFCDDSFEDDFVPATGHNYEKGICTNCGDVSFYLEAPVIKVTGVTSSGKNKISWNAVDGASQYKVYRATSKNGTYSRVTTTSKTYATHTNGTACKFRPNGVTISLRAV